MPQIGSLNIPPELIFLICNDLSPVDKTCLALCNRSFMEFAPHLNTLLGKSFTDISRLGDSAMDLIIDLLTRLVSHLPQYYICFACLKPHLWREVKLPRPICELPGGPRCELPKCFESKNMLFPLNGLSEISISEHFSGRINFGFHWVHLYLAMRRFYLGPSFGISTESLMQTVLQPIELTSAVFQTAPLEDAMGLISFEARVCPKAPSLCLRIQHICLVQRDQMNRMFHRDEWVEICQHQYYPTDDIATYRVNSVRACCFPGHGSTDKKGCRHDAGKGPIWEARCDRCNTARELELREIDDKYICFFSTTWKDLGAGLNPLDDRWSINTPYTPLLESLKPSDMVDPRQRFESGLGNPPPNSTQPLPNEQMYIRNLSLLQSKRFRRTMMRLDSERWSFQGI